ncbi:hypothetical protein VNO77_27279 [Canavalia gladiata]|uniref:Uncharacterized protein n=1 Tax=Canavalia gladiata TaxID=3824 RepID=A0AAN9KWY4_CANGL
MGYMMNRRNTTTKANDNDGEDKVPILFMMVKGCGRESPSSMMVVVAKVVVRLMTNQRERVGIITADGGNVDASDGEDGFSSFKTKALIWRLFLACQRGKPQFSSSRSRFLHHCGGKKKKLCKPTTKLVPAALGGEEKALVPGS